MSYHDMAGWSQVIAMTIFGTVLAGVLVYALKPGNRAKFDAASRLPLLSDDEEPVTHSERHSRAKDDKEGVSHGRT